MTKNELVRELAEELEVPRRDIAGIIEALLEKMTGVLKVGDKVQLTPFDQFKIRDRAARVARNPQTGEPVDVPVKSVLKFIAGKPLKEAIVGTPRGDAAKKAVPSRKKVVGTPRKGAASRAKSCGLAKRRPERRDDRFVRRTSTHPAHSLSAWGTRNALVARKPALRGRGSPYLPTSLYPVYRVLGFHASALSPGQPPLRGRLLRR